MKRITKHFQIIAALILFCIGIIGILICSAMLNNIVSTIIAPIPPNLLPPLYIVYAVCIISALILIFAVEWLLKIVLPTKPQEKQK